MDFEILGLLIFPKVVKEMQQVFSWKGRLFDRLKENSPYRTQNSWLCAGSENSKATAKKIPLCF